MTMAQSLNAQRIDAVFQSRPDIIARISQAAGIYHPYHTPKARTGDSTTITALRRSKKLTNCTLDSPARIALFNEIADHVFERLQEHGEPAQKKRKVGAETSGSPSSQAALSNAADEAVLVSIAEISVSVPQRKKLEICFTSNHLYARAPGTTAPLQGVSYAWRDIGSSDLTSAI